MLDDLKYIHQRDAQDALGIAEKQWQQLQHDFDADLSSIDKSKIQNVVYAGMGGSALPAVFMQAWPGANLPFEIVRNYSIPDYVNQATLFIVASYSGNTEETLAALAVAESKGVQLVVFTAGGKLLEIAKEKGYPTILIPSGIQPRMSSFYFIAGFVKLAVELGLVASDKTQELKTAAVWLSEQIADWRPDVAAKDNPAKKLAIELAGKTVIVYAGPAMAPAANKFKICINENAKNLAWFNQYPEFNHNEFIGWSSHPVVKPFAVVEIRSNLENDRIKKRFVISDKLLSGKRPSPQIIEPKGETILQQLLWTSVFGDFTSIYLALLNNIDPTPVDLVERLKKELA